MRDWIEVLSNSIALTIVLAAILGIASLPVTPGQNAPGASGMEVTLEAEPAPPAAPDEVAKIEPPPPPEPVALPPPPPPPPAVEEPKPTEEPPKEAEMLLDEEGEQTKLAKLTAVAPELNSKFAECILKKAVYPTTKEAKRLKPRGVVQLKAYVADSKIVALEIVETSGSPILDAAARSTVLNSGCGPIVTNGVVVGALQY